MRRNRFKRTFTFESLENRRMLDGNVTTSLSSGVLTITGDPASNGVAVFNSSSGVVEVKGLNTVDPTTEVSTPTTINGAASKLINGVTSIVFDFNAGLTGVNKGDDQIVITNLNITGSINIATADGNNVIALGQFDNSGGLVDTSINSSIGADTFGGGLTINFGGGNDHIVGKDVTIQGPVGQNLTVNGGDGSSSILFDNVSVTHASTFTDTGALTLTLASFSSRNLTVKTGIGNDSITLSNSTIVQKTDLETNLGNDTVNLYNFASGSLDMNLGGGTNIVSTSGVVNITNESTINSGNDLDTINLTSFNAHSLTVSLGQGDDSLTLNNDTFGGMVNLSGSDGADTITLTTVSANNLTVTGGSGNDSISLTSVHVNMVTNVNGGDGADTVTLDSVSTTTLNANLGAGADQLTVSAGSAAKSNLDGGDGNDVVSLSNYTVTKLNVTLDNGSDSIALTGVHVSGVANLFGGAGDDTYTDNGGNTGSINKTNFEHV